MSVAIPKGREYDVNLENFDSDHEIEFGDMENDPKGKYQFYRIPVKRVGSGGKLGPLIIKGPEDLENDDPESWCYSPGINPEYRSVGFALYSQDGATPKQREWIQNFQTKIVEKCRDKIISVIEAYVAEKEAGKDKPKKGKKENKEDILDAYKNINKDSEIFTNGKFNHIKGNSGEENGGVSGSPFIFIKIYEGDVGKEHKEHKIFSTFLKYDEKVADTPRPVFEKIKDPYVELAKPNSFKAKFTIRVDSIYVDAKNNLSMQIKLQRAVVISNDSNRYFKIGKHKKTEVPSAEGGGDLVTGTPRIEVEQPHEEKEEKDE
jgi:hypothetical protein